MGNNTPEFTPKFKGMKEKDISKIKYRDYHIYGYDEKGNKIYLENSNGYWKKQEYDEKGNKICSEDSGGDWIKWEYDKKGEIVYRTEGKYYLLKKT